MMNRPCKMLMFLLISAVPLMAQTQTVSFAKDGFPTGPNTPEGAACDLARAFITSDVGLLTNVCLKSYGAGETGKRYNDFLKMICTGTAEDKKRTSPHPKNPSAITKVFAARHFTMNGPASWAYAAHNFHDVMFVDVVAKLHDGTVSTNRTVVVKFPNGIWRVHPCPTIDDLLSAGLNEESPSTIEVEGP